ncbi:MAG: hypothetical protein V4638_07395 [Bacteroidota bacterium]
MNIEYREPKSLDELASLFQLRHKVYSHDPELCKMVDPTSTFDINWYDFNAIHFGAFCEGVPIAYIRMTTPHENHFTDWVKEIQETQNILIVKKEHVFPFQNYYPDTRWTETFVKTLEGKKIGEVGKLAIDPSFRKGGGILKDLYSSFLHHCITENGFDAGFGSCSLELERYYKKFGFVRAEGSFPFVFDDLPLAVIVCFDVSKHSIV